MKYKEFRMTTNPGDNLTPKEQAQDESALSTFGGFAEDAASTAFEDISESFGFAKKKRSSRLLDSQNTRSSGNAPARFKVDDPDWRVKIGVPSQFSKSGLLKPLASSGNAMIFPYTPTIILGHNASYNSLQPVHTNYPFQVYENSSVQEIVITGDFTVENAQQGQYWIAVIHFLRSITKMFYGGSDNSGQPPPLVKLDGYGDYVFNKVPCVITNFTVDMPANVDYIAVPMQAENVGSDTPGGAGGQFTQNSGTAWAPSNSLITVTLQPTYSRKQVSQFNLNDFVNGDFIVNGRGFI